MVALNRDTADDCVAYDGIAPIRLEEAAMYAVLHSRMRPVRMRCSILTADFVHEQLAVLAGDHNVIRRKVKVYANCRL